MKTLFSVFFTILISINLLAQVPQKLSYQAVIRTNTNALVTSKTVGMQISLLKGSANGASVYVETQNPTTNGNGLVSLEIGAGTILKGIFSAIDWAAGPYFVKIETDPNGGSSYSISRTSELLSVPYALFSLNGTRGPQGPPGEKGETGGYVKHFIGEHYGGGIVFYVYDNGQHGLIAAKESFSAKAWNNGTGKFSGATGDGIGAGFMNTMLIVANLLIDNPTGVFAARACQEYSVIDNGVKYGDWYLPSKYEMRLLLNQRNIIGGLESNHWTSTEVFEPNHGAWDTLQDVDYLEGTYTQDFVRAIRAF